MTWTYFMKKLNSRYLDMARHADAREKFERICQGKDETAAVFFECFEVLVSTAEYKEDNAHSQ